MSKLENRLPETTRNVREVVATYVRTGAVSRPIRHSQDVLAMVADLIPDGPAEHFIALGMDSRNRVLAHRMIGGLTGVEVDTSAIFRWALLTGCASFVVAHNHPSGDPNPSPEDVAITRRLAQGAKLLGLRLLDHLIVARDDEGKLQHHSFVDAGMLGGV